MPIFASFANTGRIRAGGGFCFISAAMRSKKAVVPSFMTASTGATFMSTAGSTVTCGGV